MTGTTWAAVDTSNASLIRKSLRGGVFLAAASATLPTSITSGSTPTLSALPTGYKMFGMVSDNGCKISSDVSTSDVKAWGKLTPVRSDITSDVVKAQLTALETNKLTVETFFGVSSTTADATSGEVQVIKPSGSTVTYHRMLVVGLDGDDTNFSYVAWDLPYVSLTDRGDQTFSSGDDPLEWDMTFTAYPDPTAGYSARFLAGGTQWLALKTAMGWS